MALSDDLRDASRRFHAAMRRGSLVPKKKRARRAKQTPLMKSLLKGAASLGGVYTQWPVKAALPEVTHDAADLLVRYGHNRVKGAGRDIGIP